MAELVIVSWRPDMVGRPPPSALAAGVSHARRHHLCPWNRQLDSGDCAGGTPGSTHFSVNVGLTPLGRGPGGSVAPALPPPRKTGPGRQPDVTERRPFLMIGTGVPAMVLFLPRLHAQRGVTRCGGGRIRGHRGRRRSCSARSPTRAGPHPGQPRPPRLLPVWPRGACTRATFAAGK